MIIASPILTAGDDDLTAILDEVIAKHPRRSRKIRQADCPPDGIACGQC
ncbi:hypothetical protein [Prosthecochloris sp. SCSIO W1103]|nr:hypothetical protein [Prosthecochloris sp. SCSIO W1103]UZJ38393.1 hypothetical protein OO005_04105 [Prosthecochloris sp. SCSIO W1103]